jgi:Zn-dependent oligopeptidase
VTTPQYQSLEREWQPKLAAAADEIDLNPRLFQRIEAVYQSLPGADLDPDQKRLATRMYENLVRRGARLDATQKERLSSINQELASLFAEFRAKRTRRREHVDGAGKRSRPRRAPRHGCVRGEGGRRRARAVRQMGHRQHAIEC